MSLDLCIAGIRISIKGCDFKKRWSPVEKKLLAPFIIKRPAGENASITVFTRSFKIAPAGEISPAASKLAELLKDFFHYKGKCPSWTFFDLFLKNGLTPYLKGNARRQKKLAALLKDSGGSGNRILFQYRSFVFYDKKSGRYELVLGKTNPSSKQRPWALDNLAALKLLFRMIVNSKKDGALLHASSVEQDGAGYVFVGPGGAGKSTVARMLSPDRILSDDTTVVRQTGHAYTIHSNPWWNLENPKCPARPFSPVPLKALFFIEKGKRTRLEALDYKAAMATLIYRDIHFQQAGLCDNKEGVKAFYLLAQDLLARVPTFKLRIKKSRNFRAEFLKLINRFNLRNK